MNTKELAEMVGSSRDSVCYWIRKTLPEVKMGKGVVVDLTEAQALAIVKAMPKKNIITRERQNAVQGTQSAVFPHEQFQAIVESAVRGAIAAIKGDLLPSPAVEAKPAQIEAPKMTPRAELNRIIRAYAAQDEIGHGEVWDLLYIEAKYRLGVDLKLRAKHRQIMALDVAEELGLIPQLVAIAREVFA
jgi:hypothetical protein